MEGPCFRSIKANLSQNSACWLKWGFGRTLSSLDFALKMEAASCRLVEENESSKGFSDGRWYE